jgi:hypothetical protein
LAPVSRDKSGLGRDCAPHRVRRCRACAAKTGSNAQRKARILDPECAASVVPDPRRGWGHGCCGKQPAAQGALGADAHLMKRSSTLTRPFRAVAMGDMSEPRIGVSSGAADDAQWTRTVRMKRKDGIESEMAHPLGRSPWPTPWPSGDVRAPRLRGAA